MSEGEASDEPAPRETKVIEQKVEKPATRTKSAARAKTPRKQKSG